MATKPMSLDNYSPPSAQGAATRPARPSDFLSVPRKTGSGPKVEVKVDAAGNACLGVFRNGSLVRRQECRPDKSLHIGRFDGSELLKGVKHLPKDSMLSGRFENGQLVDGIKRSHLDGSTLRGTFKDGVLVNGTKQLWDGRTFEVRDGKLVAQIN